MGIHPAAKPFHRSLRELIANGPLFDQTDGGGIFHRGDGTCCWLALAEVEPAACLKVSDADKDDLIARNDAGRYCCREHLIYDLLGEPPTSPPGSRSSG